MVSDTLNGTGKKPFTPDQNRGKWEKPTDYIFACFGLALKLDLLWVTYFLTFDIGIFGMMPYFVYMVIYLVPILVIHSFMGQFSSSGFISAFRISPFFKGMGYVSGFLTLSMLIYYSIFAAVPLLFIVNSFRPTLPWSCEGMKSWYNQSADESTICNVTDGRERLDREYYTKILEVPSILYFLSHFEVIYYILPQDLNEKDYELSWHFVGYFVIVWSMIALIFSKFSGTAKFGKLIRFMVLGTLGLLIICLVRFLFLPGAINGLLRFATPHIQDDMWGMVLTFVMMLQAFGAGWGSVITLSSFNKFQTNIMSYSWIISFGQIFIYILFSMVSFMLEHHFQEVTVAPFDTHVMSQWILFLPSASVLACMEYPNLWTFIYYTMLLMASLTVMITQIFTILQSLFDEFEQLRARKKEVTFGLIGGLALCSLFFCTNNGIINYSALSVNAIMSHCVLHLLLILVVLWIYGRERFQRDIKFMLGQPFASWKVFILRFISPFFIGSFLLLTMFEAIFFEVYTSLVVQVLSILLIGLPWLAIPGFAIYFIYQSSGTFCFRRSCRPTEWYPMDMEDRQRYEKLVGNNVRTRQQLEVTEEVN